MRSPTSTSQRSLHETFTGGIGSYMLLVMGHRLFQQQRQHHHHQQQHHEHHHEYTQFQHRDEREDLGSLLIR